MKILGYEYEHLDDEHLTELGHLESEGAIYADHWIPALDDFRHVRIEFTPGERSDYARRLWAWDQFIGAGTPALAADVPTIDSDIAQEADAYGMVLIDGTVIDAPFTALQPSWVSTLKHWFAAMCVTR